jgi:cation transport regulator ChaB
MPYTLKNPPDWLKNLPPGAQRIGVTVFNSTYQALTGSEAEREERARIAAWAAIKQKYTRSADGKWTRREKDITDPREIVALVGTKTNWFSIELEPNVYSYDRTAMVNFGGSEGIRLEWGYNEGTGDWDLITVWFDDSIYTKLAAEQFIKAHKTEMASEQYKPRKIDGRMFLKFAEDPLMAPQKVVYGEFLRPWYTDSQGHFCSEYEIGKAVHEFMIEYAAGRTKGIGINHVIWGGVGELVECFQATDDQKMFTPGSGVAGIRCSDPTWAKVQNGELNGLSIGGSWTLIPIIPRVDYSKGIFQLMDIHIKDMSLVIKGAIRKDFTAFKTADGRTEEIEDSNAGDESASNRSATFLQKPKGGRRLMDVKAIAKQVLAEFLTMVGRKQEELQPVTPEALGDVNALATQMNLIISRVNANTAAILSADAASADAGAEGQPKEQEKPPEGKPAGEGEGGGTGGEGGEGEGGGQGEGEEGTQGKPGAGEGEGAEGGGGEGEGGGEGAGSGEGEGAGAGEGEKGIAAQLSIITDLVRGIDHRVQVIETARGITMQDRIRGTKGAHQEKPGMRYSTMFNGYVPVEEESGSKK